MNPEQLERFARHHPKAYKLQVGVLAIFGYAYIIFVLVIFGGAIAILASLLYSHPSNPFAFELLIVLLIPLFLILRSLLDALTFKIPSPSGISLKRQTTPLLFQLLDQLTQALACPPFEEVILTTELNASIVQLPRFGVLSRSRNYLTLGLPLLQSLGIDQIKAVLAHELGHLSGNHSQFTAWVYRMRQTWQFILNRFSQGSQGEANFLFTPFLRWYIPFFNAYSFILARSDEYEADRCAMELAGRTATASALIQVNLKALAQSDFWQHLYRQVVQVSEPPSQPFTHLGDLLQVPLQFERQQQALGQILAIQTDADDTHPCLSDRLRALGVSLEEIPFLLTAQPQSTPAVQLLGDASSALIAQFNQNWQTSITFQWKEQHQQCQRMQHRLEILTAKALNYPLTLAEAWEQAQLTAKLKTEAEAIPLLQFILYRKPDHAWANYLLGQILVQDNDERGIEYLKTAMEKDCDRILDGCQLIYHFLRLQGEAAPAEIYRQKAEEYTQELAWARQERSQFRRGDRYQVPQIPSKILLPLRRQLAQYPEIKTAYLVQRVVKHLPQKPCYILGLQRTRQGLCDRELLDRLVQELDCPAGTIVVLCKRANWWLGRKIRSTIGEPLYQAPNKNSKF